MTIEEAIDQLNDHLLKCIDDRDHAESSCDTCLDDPDMHSDECADASIEAINVAISGLNYFKSIGMTPEQLLRR